MEVTGQTLGGKVGVRFGEMTQRLGCGSLEREITSKRKQCWFNLHELATFCKNPLMSLLGVIDSFRDIGIE